MGGWVRLYVFVYVCVRVCVRGYIMDCRSVQCCEGKECLGPCGMNADGYQGHRGVSEKTENAISHKGRQVLYYSVQGRDLTKR